ncbi:MAG: hypothetical protein QXL94_06165 [Candidatus Parvarchaeum sp.]
MTDRLLYYAYPTISEILAKKYKLKYENDKIYYPTTELVDMIDIFLSELTETYNYKPEDIDRFRTILMNNIFNRVKSKLRLPISMDENGNIYIDREDADIGAYIDEKSLKLEVAILIDEKALELGIANIADKEIPNDYTIPNDIMANICDNIDIYEIVESSELEEFRDIIEKNISYCRKDGQLMLEFSTQFLTNSNDNMILKQTKIL